MATAGRPNGRDFRGTLGPVRIGIATAEWNSEITHALRAGALAVLEEAGIPADHTLLVPVPGAFELPVACGWLLNAGGCDAAIALGSVIRGETPHFDFVCDAAATGLMRVALDHQKPVLFGVLTDDTWDQARARSGGAQGNKGADCAAACLAMLALKAQLG